jgi:hypothetical protein
MLNNVKEARSAIFKRKRRQDSFGDNIEAKRYLFETV